MSALQSKAVDKIFALMNEGFEKWRKEKPVDVRPLPESGSNRRYFRIYGKDITAIGVYNEDREENEAFLYLSQKFREAGANVPEIYCENLDAHYYLQEDLGDISLYSLVEEERIKGNEQQIKAAYQKVIDQMPLLQVEAAKGMDFDICYPRKAFDEQSMQWDLNYFKYYFLKKAYIPFHEQLLEDDFQKLIHSLLEVPRNFFLFRDFQSRNVMIKKGQPYFIDYQGGREGALQYDLASMLFESKTQLEPEFRQEMLDYYVQVFSKYDFFNADDFKRHFPSYVLIRMLQAFGAYGYRGLFERKVYFLKSIVPGLENIKWLLDHSDLEAQFPYLCSVLRKMIKNKKRFEIPNNTKDMTVTIFSFSYKNNIPVDISGNGGGFVFDCRGLHNPGRYAEYRQLTGLNPKVIDFLKKRPEVDSFIEHAISMVEASINTYIERGLNHLMVCFGCTGGQHRSVYSAQCIFNHLKENSPVNLKLIHREIETVDSHDKNHVQEEREKKSQGVGERS